MDIQKEKSKGGNFITLKEACGHVLDMSRMKKETKQETNKILKQLLKNT
jgi:hypothetical protein